MPDTRKPTDGRDREADDRNDKTRGNGGKTKNGDKQEPTRPRPNEETTTKKDTEPKRDPDPGPNPERPNR